MRHVYMTFDTGALETPITLAVAVTDAPTRRTKAVYPIRKSERLDILHHKKQTAAS